MANETVDSFTCDMCKNTFSKMPDGDEKAEAEYPEVFGILKEQRMDGIVCDDCWQHIVVLRGLRTPALFCSLYCEEN